MTGSSAECVEAKIASESCGQVNVAPAESVKKNSPDVPSVLQKPRVTPLRLPAEGEPYKCECEWETAEIVGMAESISRMLELPMKVADVDKLAVLDGQIARGSLPKLQQAHLHDEDSQHDESVRGDVPEAHGVPLGREWTACASDSLKSSGDVQSGRTHR